MRDISATGKATLYATPGSGNSLKPALALRQLGIPHRIRIVDVLAGETRSPSFLAINPAGQVPYFVDTGGFGISESNAMLWYIAEGSRLMPAEAADRAKVLQWMFFEQTRLEPNISPARFYTRIVPDREREFALEIPRWRSNARVALRRLDDFLATSDFVAPRHGYSIGDIALYGYGHLAGEAGVDLAEFGHVGRWIARIESMPRFVPLDDLFATHTEPAPIASAA
jgi:glutathione S-transferase